MMAVMVKLKIQILLLFFKGKTRGIPVMEVGIKTGKINEKERK